MFGMKKQLTSTEELANAFGIFHNAKTAAENTITLAETERGVEDAILAAEENAFITAQEKFNTAKTDHALKVVNLNGTIAQADKLAAKISDFLD